ncbi:hypothetical protein ACQ4PT_065632 [Festuca glaucescens]
MCGSWVLFYFFFGKKLGVLHRSCSLPRIKRRQGPSEQRQAVAKGAFFSSVAPPSSFRPRTPAASLCSPPHRPREMGKDGLGGDGPEVPLLKKTHFHGNCPGCRLDRRKETRRGVPYTEFACMWLVIVCSTLPIQSLFPFLYFMIRDLHIAKQVEDIGFYAGFIGASYMIGRALTSTVWGIVADKHGRKPVFVVTLIAVIILNTLFGLSSSYWMALTTRCLLGLFSGMLGPIKAYATEVCQKEYSHLSLSLVSSSRAIGLIVGPAIGGYLAQVTVHLIFHEKLICTLPSKFVVTHDVLNK